VNDRYIKLHAIVLGSNRFGEGHKVVNLFTDVMGKTEASAFGARKTRSRFGSRLEPFTVGNMLLYRKDQQGLCSIREVDTVHPNSGIRDDLNRFLVGNALVESVIRYVDREHPDRELYELLSRSLRILNSIRTSKCRFLLEIYNIKFLTIMGYRPDVMHCTQCNGDLEKENPATDAHFGFPICHRCRRDTSSVVVPGAVRFIQWALENDVSQAEKVAMNEETFYHVRQVVEHLYVQTFDKLPQSWQQLKIMYDDDYR
jgi:DNA repair protein RecO (recombination protein O)